MLFRSPVEVPETLRPTIKAQRTVVLLTSTASAAERKQAADALEDADLRSSAELVEALARAAQGQGPAEERRAFVGALVRGKATSPAVLRTLDALANDEEPTVRLDAIIGAARLRIALGS